MPAREVVGEFEARRVERMLRELLRGLLRSDEQLRVLRGVAEAGWLTVQWELADDARRWVYCVEVRTAIADGTARGPGLGSPSSGRLPQEREAVDLVFDFLASEFEACLRDERRPFTGPRWEEVAFDRWTLHTRGQVVNETAESQAGHWIEAGPPDPAAADGREPS
jgi:hypothetical protein